MHLHNAMVWNVSCQVAPRVIEIVEVFEASLLPPLDAVVESNSFLSGDRYLGQDLRSHGG